MESPIVKKITVTDDIAVAEIVPPQKMPHLAYTVINSLSEKNIRIISLNISHITGAVTLAVNKEAVCEILKITGHKSGILTTVRSENSKITILGENLDDASFLVKNILDPLSEYNADISLISASPYEISLILPSFKTEPFLCGFTK